jgi:hypothetical protein
MIYWQGKTEQLGKKPVPVPLCPSQKLIITRLGCIQWPEVHTISPENWLIDSELVTFFKNETVETSMSWNIVQSGFIMNLGFVEVRVMSSPPEQLLSTQGALWSLDQLRSFTFSVNMSETFPCLTGCSFNPLKRNDNYMYQLFLTFTYTVFCTCAFCMILSPNMD